MWHIFYNIFNRLSKFYLNEYFRWLYYMILQSIRVRSLPGLGWMRELRFSGKFLLHTFSKHVWKYCCGQVLDLPKWTVLYFKIIPLYLERLYDFIKFIFFEFWGYVSLGKCFTWSDFVLVTPKPCCPCYLSPVFLFLGKTPPASSPSFPWFCWGLSLCHPPGEMVSLAQRFR